MKRTTWRDVLFFYGLVIVIAINLYALADTDIAISRAAHALMLALTLPVLANEARRTLH